MSIPSWLYGRIIHHITKLEHDNKFTVLKWPPQSPDLYPIEYLGCGGTGAWCPGCASHKSPSTARCYPIYMGQHF